MSNDDKIEALRQQTLLLAARMGALETTTRILFAMLCSYDGSPQMLDKLKGGIFPMMLKSARQKTYDGVPPELAKWLVDNEVTILTKEFEAIIGAIEDMRKAGTRTLN